MFIRLTYFCTVSKLVNVTPLDIKALSNRVCGIKRWMFYHGKSICVATKLRVFKDTWNIYSPVCGDVQVAI